SDVLPPSGAARGTSHVILQGRSVSPVGATDRRRAAPPVAARRRHVCLVRVPGMVNASGVDDDGLVCSAKGCREAAGWVLAWNNPKLHAPERRKTWLACDEHREHLSTFLGVRGFL